MIATLFAHQGGWDEALLVLGPLLAIAGMLFLANRRVNRKLQDLKSAEQDSPTPPDTATPTAEG